LTFIVVVGLCSSEGNRHPTAGKPNNTKFLVKDLLKKGVDISAHEYDENDRHSQV